MFFVLDAFTFQSQLLSTFGQPYDDVADVGLQAESVRCPTRTRNFELVYREMIRWKYPLHP